MPTDFVLIGEAVPDVILEIRYYSTCNFTGRRVPGYEEPVGILTRVAADALRHAAELAAKDGYRLKVFDAYRPQRAVNAFERWVHDPDDTRMKPFFYPDTDKSELIEREYISTRSSHTRGSTLDVTLFDLHTGQDADMGSPFDYFGARSASAYTQGLTPAQLEKRGLLRGYMTACGFRGIRSEWWHFTLADEPYPDTYFDFPVRADSVKA